VSAKFYLSRRENTLLEIERRIMRIESLKSFNDTRVVLRKCIATDYDIIEQNVAAAMPSRMSLVIFWKHEGAELRPKGTQLK